MVELEVLQRIKTNKDTELGGTINTNFDTAHVGGSINLDINPTGSGIIKLSYKNGFNKTLVTHTLKVEGLTANSYFKGKVLPILLLVSNAISVSVGDQVLPVHHLPPGTIDAGYTMFLKED